MARTGAYTSMHVKLCLNENYHESILSDILSECGLQSFSYVCAAGDVRALDCSLLVSGIKRCYIMIGIQIPQQDKENILQLAMDYMLYCGNPAQEEFLSCYANVLKYCDEYQSVNPLMFDVITARSVIYGLCDNREVLTNGMECAMQKSALFHNFLSQCYGNKYFVKAMDATGGGNWSSFCMDTHAEFTCMETILSHFDCGEKFLEVVRHYAYAIQPWQCRDATDNYHWIRTYGAVSNGGGVAMACRMDTALMFSVGATSARFIINIVLNVLLVLMGKFLNSSKK